MKSPRFFDLLFNDVVLFGWAFRENISCRSSLTFYLNITFLFCRDFKFSLNLYSVMREFSRTSFLVMLPFLIGLQNLGNMVFGHIVLIFSFFKLFWGIDKEDILIGAILFKDNNGCRDRGVVEDICWQADNRDQ